MEYVQQIDRKDIHDSHVMDAFDNPIIVCQKCKGCTCHTPNMLIRRCGT